MSRNVVFAPSFFACSFDFNSTIRSPPPSLVTSIISSPRIDFNSLWLPARHGAQPGGHVARHSSAVSGLPWSYTPSRGCGTSTGTDPSPIQRKMTSRLVSVGQRCSPISGEGNDQGVMLVGDNHYCRAVITSTSRIHPFPHTGRTSRQTRRPHCGGGPLNYSQHRRATVERRSGQQEDK
ncbi:hypothetical protein PoB_005793800 [Plakobranchus ocellatus]|uniref:Uncharacterized protein n=1 Tax=Plakobranchus ocellatus TaxID=259542 RepID=A0AAV4CHK2_9GAST|nr:hypothetical protein PoB_005793800 [Plakobranchus ocellatus]